MSLRALLVTALVTVGCGRVGFDPTGAASDGNAADTSGDALAALDCAAVSSDPRCVGLVALLHFDNDPGFGETATFAHDYSGRGNDATCTTCPSFAPTGGRFGGAFTFTEPQAFAIASSASMSITGAVTMSAWFYPNTLATGWRIIITKIQATPLIANYGIPHNGGALCVNFATLGGGWQNHCSAATYVPDRWYHLVGVIDGGAQRASLYVDGAQVLDQAEPMAMQADAGQVWIGWSPTNAGVDGRIDEVAIWNRALTPAEIALL